MNPKLRAWRQELLERLADGPFAALTVLHGRRYVADYPEDAWGWTLLGIALREVARYTEAEQALRAGLDLWEPKHRHLALHEMGRLFDESGAHDEAARWYRGTERRSPPTPPMPRTVSSWGMLAKLGRFVEAEAEHRAATQCAEGDIDEAYLNLGFVLRAQARFAEAAACFCEAIHIDPGYKAARRALRDVELCIKCAEPEEPKVPDGG